jgi:ABC-2 type transport system permease protein
MRVLRVVYIIWLREFKNFIREPTRLVGMIGQPLLYLLIVGQGIAAGMSLKSGQGAVGYMQFMYPGILGMSVLFTSVFSAVSIIWDREFGFLKEVLVAPVPRWGVAVGKILGGATVAMMQSVILIALAPVAGVGLSPLVVVELLLLCFLMSIAITSLGVFVAATMRSMQGFQMLMNLLIMPLYFLSGAMFPIISAPLWMRVLMAVDPLTYGVDALRNVVFTGTELPAEAQALIWGSLPLDVAIMALVAFLFAAVASLRFHTAD